MSYINLINRFWEKAACHAFSPAETAFYLFLLHQCNIRRWQNPFELRTCEIESALGISRSSIKRFRERFAEAGLLDFRVSTGRIKPQYLLIGVNSDSDREKNNDFGVSSEGTQKEQMGFGVSSEDTEMNTKRRVSVLVCHESAAKSDTKPSDTYYIEKDNIKTYIDKEEKEEREKPTTAVALSEEIDSVEKVVEKFMDENPISLEGFIITNRMTKDDFKERAAEVVGLWMARGWRLSKIERGAGEYQAARFLNWVSKQNQISRERTVQLQRLEPKKSRDEKRLELLRYGAECLRQARTGELRDEETEAPF